MKLRWGQRGFSYRRNRLPSKSCRGVLALLIGCLGLLASSTPVQAAQVTLPLSDFVSTEPNQPAVADLNASVTFSLVSSPIALPAVLTITFANDTAAPAPYRVDSLLFNIPDIVDSAILTGNPQNKWVADFDNSAGGGIAANGFGDFDLRLIDDVGNGVAKISSGTSETFELTLDNTLGGGTISLSDFVSEFSEVTAGELPMVAAAKFAAGPGGEEGFGAAEAIPEPATIAFVAIGVLFLRRRR